MNRSIFQANFCWNPRVFVDQKWNSITAAKLILRSLNFIFQNAHKSRIFMLKSSNCFNGCRSRALEAICLEKPQLPCQAETHAVLATEWKEQRVNKSIIWSDGLKTVGFPEQRLWLDVIYSVSSPICFFLDYFLEVCQRRTEDRLWSPSSYLQTVWDTCV